MNRLDLCPLQSGYSASFGDGVVSTPALKGMPRTRLDFVGAVHMVNASFLLGDGDYGYLMSFYRVYQRNPQPFIARLILDTPLGADYQCKFVGDSLRFNSKDGKYVSVSCQLYAAPLAIDIDYDESVVALRNVGTNGDVLKNLDKLVNVALPDALENL